MKTRRFLILAKTEATLALRSPDMVLFGMIMPLVILFITALIWKGDEAMIARNIGAWLSIGIAAVALMGMPLTLADYRQKKVLKRFQVSPASPGLLLAAQVLVQGLVACLSALLVAAAAALAFGWRPEGNPLAILASYLLALLSIMAIGMCITSLAPDSKKAGLICSIAYFPMLLLSGTTIPLEVFPAALQKASAFLPLSQGIALINAAASGTTFAAQLPRILLLAGIFALGATISLKTFKWENTVQG